MAETLNAKIRSQRGTRAARRMREQGMIPAVLYGHGQENVHLALAVDELRHIIQQGTKLVELKGDVAESALIREVQWDTFGTEVIHIDFTRVSAGERVETRLPVHLRGEAAGQRAGGIIEHVLHELEIECPVNSLPDRLEVNISGLNVGESLTAGEVPLPEGAKLLVDPSLLVVHCVLPVEEGEAEPTAPEAGEPEIIGRKAEEGEEESEG